MTTALPVAGAMTPPTTDVSMIPALTHPEAMRLATTEFSRMVDALEALSADDWKQQTACSLWNVRAMVAHVVGMAEAQASFRQFLHDVRAAGKRSGGSMIDALNAAQVNDRADQTPAQLVQRLKGVAARAVRARKRTPSLLRRAVHFKQDPPFGTERWPYGFLVDTIFTRDTWVHRLDISRATAAEMVVTPEHDGRIVANVVAEWARRHNRRFALTLTGPAGGLWTSGEGGEHIELDALDFCLTVSGRVPGRGLLATPVPF